ncbi:hypothetical protein C922_02659 [Plasmodium inui San Antonio 1]|uniref:Uncharacterized protein n=1 Tax=Plasmodium inui San Antonio 1 TaxID=1237626 RepID=W7A5Q0_9APIC|nr:hypothetical protein C922_02659 [Plasmodium inui San Antonio 1]EUD67075.1 hypothetical protein C922_02659 [Plasmodium inui San Antonio 1]
MPLNGLINAPLLELLQKWEAKRINLQNVCLCLYHLKKNILQKWAGRKDFLLSSINDVTITKFVDQLDVNRSGTVADSTKDKYFFLAFVTFVFNTENELFRRSCHMTKEVEENFCRVYNQDCGSGKKNKGKRTDEESQKGALQKRIEDDKKDLLNKKVGHHQMGKPKEESRHPNNVFDQFDVLIKRAIDLEVINHTHGEGNKLLRCKIYVFYVFLKFIFSLTKDLPQISKYYLKRVRNILQNLMSIPLGFLGQSEYLVHLANVTLLLIVHTNFPAVKDCEREFLNFLIMQLNRRKYSLHTIEKILVTYLKKKKNIILNDQIYQQLQSHSNDNINLFLKYGKKENLFFFFNLLCLFNGLLHARLSNSNQNIYFVKHVECVNINVSIKEMLGNVQKVLHYLGTMSSDYLANKKKLDISLTGGGAYVYCKDEPPQEEFTIEEILKGREVMGKEVIENDPQEMSQGGLPQGEKNRQLPNLFTYIIDNVFSFFRGLIKEQDAESISMNLNHLVNFLKLFFIHNNESDLFLINFVGTNFTTYCKELLEKCPSALDELVSPIMCLFRVVNMLTQNTLHGGAAVKLMNILSSLAEIERGGSCQNGESDQSGKGLLPEESILHRLYNNALHTLSVFLKNVETYSNEQVKEKIFIQYEHFLFRILDNETNANFDLIFRNSTSLYLTLKLFFILVKLHKFDFENVHNLFFKLIKLETELPTASQQGASLFYRNGLHSNAALLQKIKTFILSNLDLISRDTGRTKVEKVERLERLAKSDVLGRADILSLFEHPITGSNPRGKLQTNFKESPRASHMNDEVTTTYNGTKKNKRALEKTKLQGGTDGTWENIHAEDTEKQRRQQNGQQKEPLETNHSSHAEGGPVNLKELADNVKMVSPSDALNSLQYMKQSILNDL